MKKIGARATLIAASIALAGCETIGPLWPENPDNYVSYSRVQDPNDLQNGGPSRETEADRAASEDAYLAEIEDLSGLDEEEQEPSVSGFIQLGWPGETLVGSGLGNPASGKKMVLPPQTGLSFRPSRNLKSAMTDDDGSDS